MGGTSERRPRPSGCHGGASSSATRPQQDMREDEKSEIEIESGRAARSRSQGKRQRAALPSIQPPTFTLASSTTSTDRQTDPRSSHTSTSTSHALGRARPLLPNARPPATRMPDSQSIVRSAYKKAVELFEAGRFVEAEPHLALVRPRTCVRRPGRVVAHAAACPMPGVQVRYWVLQGHGYRPSRRVLSAQA